MKYIISRILTRIKLLFILLAFVLCPLGNISWASDNQAAEEQITAGPTEKTGPQEPTGPIEKTGPQEPTGPIDSPNNEKAMVNEATGTNSINNNSIDSTQAVNENITENDAVENNIDSTSNTGGNNIMKNSSIGRIDTGQIDGSVNLINIAGSALNPASSIGNVSLAGGHGNIFLGPISNRQSFSSLNSITGPSSINMNKESSNNVIRIIKDKLVDFSNLINIKANTGGNNIVKNTLIGSVATGNINIAINLLNLADLINPGLALNIDFWTIRNGLSGDLILPTNSLTGVSSNNQNLLTQSQSISVNSNNENQFINNVTVNSDTGNNELNKNSYIGDFKTGETRLDGSIVNITGNDLPTYYIINVFGKWSGSMPNRIKDIAMVNEVTGFNSNNQNESNSVNQAEIESNNLVTIKNMVNIEANTGKNIVDSNSAIKSFRTGDVNILSNIANLTNSINPANEEFGVSVINIYGDWNGSLRLLEDPSAVSSAGIATNIQNNIPAVKNVNRVTKLPIAGPNTPLLNNINSSIKPSLIKSNGNVAASNNETSKKIRFDLLFLLFSGLSLIGLALATRKKKLFRTISTE